MASMSKRQQARNERTLQELIRSVPGNDRCADCSARNPSWASWSLGVFLCMRCAAIHRKLGTHVSKVKSLSMDSWSSDQVEKMKKVGNTASNKIYNPRGVPANVPIDVDEVDSAMERYIRSKYESRALADGKPIPPSRNDERYTPPKQYVEDSPPLPPPKQSKWFGFGLRSSSSSHAAKVDRASLEPTEIRAKSPPVSNKQSKVFGQSVGDSSMESLEYKLVALREMGFPDDTRNMKVLNSLNGNLERTIESLTRLGESQPSSRSRTPGGTTPTSATFPKGVMSPTKSPASSNPWDKLSPPNSGTAPSFGLTLEPPKSSFGPSRKAYNPFDVDPQQQVTPGLLDEALKDLQISQQTTQSLFPNTTGNSAPAQIGQNPYAHVMTPPPPMPAMQPAFTVTPPAVEGNFNPFFQPQQQQPQAQPVQQSNVYNPYAGNNMAQHAASNPFTPQLSSNPFGLGLVSAQSQNPYQQMQMPQPQPQHQQQQQQQQQPQFQQQPLSQSFDASIFDPSPSPSQMQQPQQQYFQPSQQQPQQQMFQGYAQAQTLPTIQQAQPYQVAPNNFQMPQYQSFQQQPIAPQRTGRVDKNAIMSLYNYPQLAPIPPQSQISTTADMPQRSATVPATLPSVAEAPGPLPAAPSAGTRNPFYNLGSGPTGGATAMNSATMVPRQITSIRGHATRESMDLIALQSGRHSPDAFASLSARHVG